MASMQQADRTAEVDECPDLRVIEHSAGLADVCGDHLRVPRLGQQRLAVNGDDRVDIDVDHARGGVDLMRDLMHVALLGSPEPMSRNCVIPASPDQVPDRAPQERPVGLRRQPRHRALSAG